MNPTILGCIADDFTGATDLANNLVRTGFRVIQTIGVPSEPLSQDGDVVDAIVIALKTRTIDPKDAVKQSLAALSWLKSNGAGQIYFKYCSTFDSTPTGNIGPVTDALMAALKTDFTIACPAFPDNGRTIFKGYLYVGDELLHESGMRNHPLTPMTDSNLVRVLQAQTQQKVRLIDYRTVAQGAAAVTKRISDLKQAGVAMAVVDAVSNADLIAMGPALAKLPLLTAGSGVAIGLKPNLIGLKPNLLPSQSAADKAQDVAKLPEAQGFKAIVSGSCSTATNTQVAAFMAQGGEAFAVDPLQLANGADVVASALAWAKDKLKQGTVLIYATADSDAVRTVQAKLGVAKSGEMVEHALAAIALGLVAMGVQQLIVAGGETSGACVQALGITSMRIGPQIAPGVPWCYAAGNDRIKIGLHIALKSGNFGGADFFTSAYDVLNP
jgi:3-dehydrotetronate 4-kinase